MPLRRSRCTPACSAPTARSTRAGWKPPRWRRSWPRCVQQAKAAETKALANAKMGKEIGAARKDAAEDKRDADYKVAAEKCDALAGDAKAACVVTARAKFGKS